MTNSIALNALIKRVTESIVASPPENATSEETFRAVALDLADFQIRNTPFLSRYFDGDSIKSLNGWDQIPLLPISAYKSAQVTSLEVNNCTYFESSGSTQRERSRHYHCSETLVVYHLSLLEGFRRAMKNHAPSRKFGIISLTPSAHLAPHSSLVSMLDEIMRHDAADTSGFAGVLGKSGGWEIDIPLFQRKVEQFQATGTPVFIAGTAFNYIQILDENAGAKVSLPPGSLVMETGGYKGQTRELPKPELYREIENFFEITSSQIFSEYGMCELSSQGYDFAGKDGERKFILPPWTRFRVLSPETQNDVAEGEIGILAIYDLANVSSYLALMTEDLVIRRGNGFEWKSRSATSSLKGCSLFVTGN